jgi:hypothetical protein
MVCPVQESGRPYLSLIEPFGHSLRLSSRNSMLPGRDKSAIVVICVVAHLVLDALV